MFKNQVHANTQTSQGATCSSAKKMKLGGIERPLTVVAHTTFKILAKQTKAKKNATEHVRLKGEGVGVPRVERLLRSKSIEYIKQHPLKRAIPIIG